MATDPGPRTDPDAPVVSTRRHVVRGAGVLLASGLAGCVGGESGGRARLAPIDLDGGLTCDVCGMVIENHPGPNGQLFYRDRRPAGHDNPARFCSLRACMLPFYFEHDRLGWTIEAGYVTDYSSVDYTLSGEGGTTYISSHTAAETFAPHEDVVYVYGGDVTGAMGADFVPFSSRDDATAFRDDRGGEVIRFRDIDPAML